MEDNECVPHSLSDKRVTVILILLIYKHTLLRDYADPFSANFCLAPPNLPEFKDILWDRNENSLKNVFHLTLAGIICLYLTFDKQQEWDNSKNIASVKWNAAKM